MSQKTHHYSKETTKPETSNSDSRRADDNELDDEDDEQPVRTNLFHQISIGDASEILHDHQGQGHDQDEQAEKVRKRKRRFIVHHLKELFEDKFGAQHFDYEQTMGSIVR